LETLDKEIVMAITSGALTMLAESGSGTLAGGAHSDTFMRVARALARRVTECFQRQFDAFILGRAFPGQPALAYFEILTNEEIDTGEIIKDLVRLKQAGFDTDAAQVEEKTSYKVTRALPTAPAVPALPNRAAKEAKEADEPTAPNDPTDDLLSASLDELLTGMQQDFRPVAERLQSLLMDADTEADLKAGLELLIEDLPKLAAQVGATDATVQSWQKILGAAAANESAA
jgi:hypothetical protein